CGDMTQPNSPSAVVVDANILISICAMEPSHATAETALADYASKGFVFYAPNVAVPELLYVLCQKLQSGLLTEAEYEKAIRAFKKQMAAISTPPGRDASLIDRAKEIQSGYGCSRSADCLYIAFAEELAKNGVTEFLTFDKGAVNQVTKHAPSVKVNLLPK
ncbi:MAG: type II toxin-antitoxin system VapC family toxin, partial [Blastocatellia bacterium]